MPDYFRYEGILAAQGELMLNSNAEFLGSLVGLVLVVFSILVSLGAAFPGTKACDFT